MIMDYQGPNPKLLVVALGGNALIKKGQKGSAEDHKKNAIETWEHLYPLVEQGYNLIVTHGNGPQVGNLVLQSDAAKATVEPDPLDVCVAQTAGSIGYYLQQPLINKLRAENSPRYTITLITQVVVDENDPAFQNPTKPIGPFYTEEEASNLTKLKSWSFVEDSGRGWRRVVPSPLPQKIVQRKMINDFVRRGHIVIALGGGGIPVIKDANSNYIGVEAVIDKDLASCELACTVKADLLIILTEVEKVCLNFNTANQKTLDEITTDEAKQYLEQKQFPAGSMGPKIKAAIEFVEKTGKDVLITSITKLQEGLSGTTGTRIVKERKTKPYRQVV